MLTLKDCFSVFPKSRAGQQLKSLARKRLLISCPRQLNKTYFETSAYESDCTVGMERTGSKIVWVQFPSKGLLYLTLSFFFFLGSGHKMAALQINVDLVFMVKAYYA